MTQTDKMRSEATRRVREVQSGSPVPKAALEKFLSARKAAQLKRFKEYEERVKRSKKYEKTILAPFVDLVPEDKRREGVRAFKEAAKFKLTRPKMEMGPKFLWPSIRFFEPPYSGSVENSFGTVTELDPEPNQGAAEAVVLGNGGSSGALAGFYAIYTPLTNLPMGSFGALVNYSYSYHEVSQLETAHTSGSIGIWVADLDEPLPLNIPLATTAQSLWQDGTGWTETHDYVNPWAQLSPNVSFPLIAGHRYVVGAELVVYADDDGDNGWLPGSAAQAYLAMNVPIMSVDEHA